MWPSEMYGVSEQISASPCLAARNVALPTSLCQCTASSSAGRPGGWVIKIWPSLSVHNEPDKLRRLALKGAGAGAKRVSLCESATASSSSKIF